MTNGKSKPAFTGLKVSLITGSLIASFIGARLIALKDGTVYTPEVLVEPAVVDRPGGNSPGAYPTIYAPDVTVPQDLPPIENNGSSNPPPPDQTSTGGGGQSASVLPPVPTAVYVEPAPMPVQPVTSSSSSR